MPHDRLRGPLGWAVAGTLLLPVVLSLMLGLAGLLAGLGDTSAALVCRRLALVVGLLWATALVATTVLNSLAIMARPPRPRCGRGPRRRRRRMRRPPDIGAGGAGVLVAAFVLAAAAAPAVVAAEPVADAKAIREQLDLATKQLDAGRADDAATAFAQALAGLNEMAALPKKPAALKPLADKAAGIRRRFERAGVALPGAATGTGTGPAAGPAPPAGPRPPQVGGGAISFSRQVAPLLVRSCGGCHVAGRKGDFQMASYQGLMQSGMVQRGAGQASRLVEVILTGDMPRGGGKVSAADVDALVRWIDAGAACDAPDPAAPLDAVARGGAATPPPDRSAPATASVADLRPGEISFAIDVAPVLATHCLKCHGGDETENGLSMATLDALLRGGRGGAAVVPRKGASSLLVRKLKGADIEGQRMPLNAPPLADAAIAAIEAWINEGARLDMLTGKTPLDNVVAAGRMRSLSDADLRAVREAAAEKVWRRAIPDEEPVIERRDGVVVVGNLPRQRMAEVADAAERLVAAAGRELPLDGPLLKGGVVLFVVGKGYDFSTLWQSMPGGERPRGATSHVGVAGEVAYGAMLVPAEIEAGDLDAFLAESAVAAAFAGRGLPAWFARGAGRTIASRIASGSDLVKEWKASSSAAAAVVPPADLLGGQVGDPLAAAAAGGGVVGMIGTGSRLGQLLARVDDGMPFDDAFAKTFSTTPAQACAAWTAKAAKRR
ncbi:MAG: c-type cytochrome domain-containing protein [Planctomycetaceae bacterium]